MMMNSLLGKVKMFMVLMALILSVLMDRMVTDQMLQLILKVPRSFQKSPVKPRASLHKSLQLLKILMPSTISPVNLKELTIQPQSAQPPHSKNWTLNTIWKGNLLRRLKSPKVEFLQCTVKFLVYGELEILPLPCHLQILLGMQIILLLRALKNKTNKKLRSLMYSVWIVLFL